MLTLILAGAHYDKGMIKNNTQDSKRGKGTADSDGSKVISIFTSIDCIVSLFHIPPVVLCSLAKLDESAFFNCSGEIISHENVLEAKLRFPIPRPIFLVLGHLSLALRKLR